MSSTLFGRTVPAAVLLATLACQHSMAGPTATSTGPEGAAASSGGELAALSSPVAPTTAASPRAGWASETGYRNAETSVQRGVVTRARAAVGQPSGQSYAVSPIGPSTPWQTDVAVGDGARMRRATERFHMWVLSRTPTLTFAQVRAQMEQDLAQTYDATRRRLLVDRIINRFNLYALPGGPSYSTDQAILSFLVIQRQCLEFASTLGLEAGGRAKGYSSAAVTNQANYRPGMALFKADRSHAMLVADIYWDANGRAIRFRVVESNWGSGWMNPNGQIPWERRVTTREVPIGDRVVDFEG